MTTWKCLAIDHSFDVECRRLGRDIVANVRVEARHHRLSVSYTMGHIYTGWTYMDSKFTNRLMQYWADHGIDALISFLKNNIGTYIGCHLDYYTAYSWGYTGASRLDKYRDERINDLFIAWFESD